LVAIEYLGSLGWDPVLGFRSGNWCRGQCDKGSGFKFPVKEAVRARVELLVALDAIEVKAHKGVPWIRALEQ
jgi:hypothetical protein